MKIGQLVRSHIKKIFHYCDTVDHGELSCLLDETYSKRTFDINFPFCTEKSKISSELSKRYWGESYFVKGKTVRVSSQWYETHVSKSRPLFKQYLLAKKIITKDEFTAQADRSQTIENTVSNHTRIPSKNSRHGGHAIGNAQNSLVRNILSHLGEESFNENDWAETKLFFSNRCAYCGNEGDMIKEHAIPINRQSLGEHRLGNLVPSCKSCNSIKASNNFREFLNDDIEKIRKIEEYMDSHNYVPLGDNKQIKMILEMAYKEVRSVSNRYISILNEHLSKT